MKKLISILFAVFLFCSCENKGVKNVENNYKVKVIDSCEYIIYSRYSSNIGYGFMAHKGNCKFCKERRLKEQNK